MDNDGADVAATTPGQVGSIRQLPASARTSYYYVASQRIAMRVGAPGTAGTLTYLHGDHLGSTSLATNGSGAELYRRGYYPFGEERYATGVAQTDYGFTGQRASIADNHGSWYNACGAEIQL